MKKRVLTCIGVLTIGTAVILGGCASGSASQNGASLSKGIEPVKGVVLQTGLSSDAVVSELKGQVIFAEGEVVQSASVYSKPNASSSVLGVLSAGARVLYCGLADNQEWYLVGYNGRVAYIPVNDVREIVETTEIVENYGGNNVFYADVANTANTNSTVNNTADYYTPENSYTYTPPADSYPTYTYPTYPTYTEPQEIPYEEETGTVEEPTQEEIPAVDPEQPTETDPNSGYYDGLE